MQKFEFKAVIYAKSMEEAKIEMRENMVRQQGIHGSMLNAFECTHVARKAPFDKKDTVYYTVRFDGKGPRLGAVMLLHKNGSWHRGVVICTAPDVFDRRYARKEAYRRAVLASKGCSSMSIAVHRSGVAHFLTAVSELPGNEMDSDFTWKSEFACRLTAYEQHLVDKKGITPG